MHILKNGVDPTVSGPRIERSGVDELIELAGMNPLGEIEGGRSSFCFPQYFAEVLRFELYSICGEMPRNHPVFELLIRKPRWLN